MNDKPICEETHLCEFRVVLAVEPPALAGRKKGMGKSEPADQFVCLFVCLFFFHPLTGVKVLSNKDKAKCEQKWLCKKRKKPWQKLRIQLMIVAKYANILLTSNRPFLISGFASVRWRLHRRLIKYHPKLAQVTLFVCQRETSGLSHAIMLELFYRTSKGVTCNLVNETQKNLLNRNAFISGYSELSVDGFRFLILLVQVTPFPANSGLHVQL